MKAKRHTLTHDQAMMILADRFADQDTINNLRAFVQHVADLHPDESLGNDARALLARAQS